MIQGFCCVICQKPILGTHRLSARYCGRVCRNKASEARRKEETLRQRNEREVVLKRHEDWLRQFQLELLRRAPPEAGGYQAGLWTGNMTYWFPTIPLRVAYRNTLNRTRSTYNFFTIDPFEPPSVALVASYTIRFVHKFYPYPILLNNHEEWQVRIPFAVPIRKLPFSLRAVPRDLR